MRTLILVRAQDEQDTQPPSDQVEAYPEVRCSEPFSAA